MMNIGVGSIITKGLGGPACNLLIFGPFHLYISPLPPVTPTPTATSGLTPTPSVTVPIPTPTPSGGGGGGGVAPGGAYDYDDDYEPEEKPDDKKYELTFVVKFRKRKIERKFIVDSFKKDQIVKRVGQINTLRIKFKTTWNKVKNNRFTAKWKK